MNENVLSREAFVVLSSMAEHRDLSYENLVQVGIIKPVIDSTVIKYLEDMKYIDGGGR